MTLQYSIARDLGIVTVYPSNLPAVVSLEAFAMDFTESDLILMLADLQGDSAYCPDGTGTL